MSIRQAATLEEDWSKEPPTEPGWYWFCTGVRRDLIDGVQICRKGSATGPLVVGSLTPLMGTESWGLLSSYEGYWQKMNVPQPPKE